jgi:hypothetical protein
MGAAKSSPSRSRARAARSARSASEREAPSQARTPGNNAAAVADYVASITAELAAMAGSARLDLLTYFLNMARLEAECLARQHTPTSE